MQPETEMEWGGKWFVSQQHIAGQPKLNDDTMRMMRKWYVFNFPNRSAIITAGSESKIPQ